MKRRQFCRGAVAASALAAAPWLAGCERKAAVPATSRAPDATAADTSIRGVSLTGSELELEKAAIRELGEALEGEVVLSGHPQYDSVRALWNGMHDKRPALIARCATAADAAKAVTFASERELLLAVRGGGHSWPGKSSCDHGLMIDLSPMNTVRVDSTQRRAYAGGGALLNALDTAALEYGLVTTAGVVSHTGVGGYTLGGGFGRLNRKHGLTIDNLRSAEIITADGQIRRTSANTEEDLFWAIRGGGGNFGVVTEFEYQLHPFDRNVLSGMIVWPIEQAREVLDFYADWHRELSDELYVGPAMMTTPEGQGILAMEVVYAGDPVAGEKELAPLRQTGTPMEDSVDLQDYMVMQTQEDAMVAHGIRSYAKSGMVGEITPDFVDAMLDAYQADPRQAFFTHTAGGAVSRVDELETAFPHRNAQTMLVFASFWADPEWDEECIAGTREWYSALEPFTGGYYDNIDFADDGNTVGNYGPAYDRLARIKGQYDPGNLFRLNSNVEPVV
jgi:FAD/FMN-containing dehydrogenase